MAESSSDHQKNVAAGCCGHPGGEGSAAETEEKVVRDRAEEDRARRLAIYRLAGTQAVREQRSVLALRDHLVHDIKENALHQGARPARLGSQRAARRLVAFNRERDAQQTARLSTRPHTELGGIDFLGSVSYPGMRPETTTGAWAGGVRAGSNGGGSGGGVDGDEDEEEGKGGLAVLLAAEKREREARGRERRRREEEEEAKLRVDIDFKVAVHRRHYERAIYPERAAELSAREAARFETEAMRARARAKEKREANTLFAAELSLEATREATPESEEVGVATPPAFLAGLDVSRARSHGWEEPAQGGPLVLRALDSRAGRARSRSPSKLGATRASSRFSRASRLASAREVGPMPACDGASVARNTDWLPAAPPRAFYGTRIPGGARVPAQWMVQGWGHSARPSTARI